VKEQTLWAPIFNLLEHQQVCAHSIFLGRNSCESEERSKFRSSINVEFHAAAEESAQGCLLHAVCVCVFMGTYYQLQVYWFNNPCTCLPPLNTFVCTAQTVSWTWVESVALKLTLIAKCREHLFAHFDCFTCLGFDNTPLLRSSSTWISLASSLTVLIDYWSYNTAVSI